MAFVISEAPPSFSESEGKKVNLKDDKDSEGVNNGMISSQLLLKSAGRLDRDVVLRRIRYYKRLNRVKSTFQALASSSESAYPGPVDGERWWLQQGDVFTSP